MGADADSGAIDAVAGFATHIARRWRGRNDLGELIDNELWELEEGLTSIGQKARAEVYDVRTRLEADIGELPLFEIAELAHAVVYIAGERWDRAVPRDSRYVFAGLATRAVATMREIAILLEQGYAFGARSRWRTLSEILVVARVLTLGDRYTATRYKEHRWIMLRDQRRKTGYFQWTSDLPTPEVMARRLCRRFGVEYGGMYGWAARLSARELGVAKPGWSHLKTLANVDEHETRVHDAHHSVHGADSLGLLGSVGAGFGTFHAGASSYQVIPVARDSVRLFRQTMSAIFNSCTQFSDARKPLILRGILDGHAFNLEQALGWQVITEDGAQMAHYLSAMKSLFGDVLEVTEP
ncbi:hypothetical protein GCM10009651_16450 [Microbacterium natoriense]|uniref:DUF5677 domain-containing protein n=1 Tax=Microbacterium natoriense TaxID=284570 RepID=UPI0031E10AD0